MTNRKSYVVFSKNPFLDPDSALSPLQRVLHAAARFVAAIGPRDHITPTLISLHWLPVRQRITYTLCTMMHSVFYGQAPSYISEIVTPLTHLPAYQAVPTYVRRKTETIRHSTCTLWIRSAFVLGIWTWCLEQSASSTERHHCCLHLQASLKDWTLLSSLRRFNDCFNRCWSLRLFALLIDVFFFIDDMCVFFIFSLFLVSLALYVDIYIFTLSSAAIHLL